MTIASTVARNDYTGAGSVGPYAYNFKVFAATELDVIRRDTTTGIETQLAYLTDYTVAGAGNASGSITLITALAVGQSLTIRQNQPLTQTTDIRNAGSFFPENHEDRFDRLTLAIQQHDEELGRTLKLSRSLIPSASDVEVSAPGTGKVITTTPTGFALATLDASAVAVPGSGRTVATLTAYLANNKTFNVADYGALADWNGSSGTDNAPAFNAALAAALLIGGTVLVPPGKYYLNATWLGTWGVNYVCVAIEGYGAELYAGASVTGSALKVVGAPQPHGIAIRGLKFNHRNNTTATACVELQGHSHAIIEDITVEMHNTAANWAAILLSSLVPGDDNYGCFWVTIRRVQTRMRTGGEGTPGTHGVWLKGGMNAARIFECAFGNVVNAISLTTDGVSTTLANGVCIGENAFEGTDIQKAINVVATPTTGYYPTGLRVYFNRCENVAAVTGAFFSMITGGAAANNHSNPPFLLGNYCTNGSVANWINNPLNAWITVLESTSGVNAGTRLQSIDHFRVVTSGAKNLLLANESGGSSWTACHLQFGEDAGGAGHIWVDTGTGTLRYKFGTTPPTSATDGSAFAVAGNAIGTVGTSPRFTWNKTDDAVDQKNWDFIAGAGLLQIRALNDALGSANSVFQITRSGFVVTGFGFGSLVKPLVDAAYDLGVAGTRWRDLFISRNAAIGGSVLSTAPAGGVGYATGAGGAVTQVTSRATGVTLNTVTGAITLVSAAGSATPASFTVTNSAVAATDVVMVSQKSGTDLYQAFVTAVGAGSFKIAYFTTGGTTTEQPVFNFVVIKGAAS